MDKKRNTIRCSGFYSLQCKCQPVLCCEVNIISKFYLWNTYSEKIKINFIHSIFLKRTSFNLPGVTLVLNIETHTSNSLPVMFDIARKTGRNSHCASTMSQQSFNLVHTELFLFFSFLQKFAILLVTWLHCKFFPH